MRIARNIAFLEFHRKVSNIPVPPSKLQSRDHSEVNPMASVDHNCHRISDSSADNVGNMNLISDALAAAMNDNPSEPVVGQMKDVISID